MLDLLDQKVCEHNGEIFSLATGGKEKLGQIWKYVPSEHEGSSDEIKSPAHLELFFESTILKVLIYCDNITVSPWVML